eukprot:gnl/Hemi2/2268_TR806_c0_g1_i1.p1 gnl/Hemi2/2268_TR806_c0_g1~~gnl/Hemi2/2268_TR806_c0_g1_i1.p1  ORF type:complete len:464 (+),score=107.69 gnl/Hemi2/2268_TR806_c0_g1_i1:11-1402(+)
MRALSLSLPLVLLLLPLLLQLNLTQAAFKSQQQGKPELPPKISLDISASEHRSTVGRYDDSTRHHGQEGREGEQDDDDNDDAVATASLHATPKLPPKTSVQPLPSTVMSREMAQALAARKQRLEQAEGAALERTNPVPAKSLPLRAPAPKSQNLASSSVEGDTPREFGDDEDTDDSYDLSAEDRRARKYLLHWSPRFDSDPPLHPRNLPTRWDCNVFTEFNQQMNRRRCMVSFPAALELKHQIELGGPYGPVMAPPLPAAKWTLGKKASNYIGRKLFKDEQALQEHQQKKAKKNAAREFGDLGSRFFMFNMTMRSYDRAWLNTHVVNFEQNLPYYLYTSGLSACVGVAMLERDPNGKFVKGSLAHFNGVSLNGWADDYLSGGQDNPLVRGMNLNHVYAIIAISNDYQIIMGRAVCELVAEALHAAFFRDTKWKGSDHVICYRGGKTVIDFIVDSNGNFGEISE